MPTWPSRLWLAACLLVIVVAGGLTLLRQRCDANGGEFRWRGLSCESASRPVILQGDLHRV